VLAQHYRTPWSWNGDIMPTAATRLKRWQAAGVGDGGLEAARAALDNDLDTPAAIVAIDAAASSGGVSEAAALLGVTIS